MDRRFTDKKIAHNPLIRRRVADLLKFRVRGLSDYPVKMCLTTTQKHVPLDSYLFANGGTEPFNVCEPTVVGIKPAYYQNIHTPSLCRVGIRGMISPGLNRSGYNS